MLSYRKAKSVLQGDGRVTAGPQMLEVRGNLKGCIGFMEGNHSSGSINMERCVTHRWEEPRPYQRSGNRRKDPWQAETEALGDCDPCCSSRVRRS